MDRVAFTAQLRRDVEAACGRTCWLCHQAVPPGERVSLDHVIPVRHAGTNELSNLRPAHTRCNTMRSDWDVASYNAWAMTGRPDWIELVPLGFRDEVIAGRAVDLARVAARHDERGLGPCQPLTGSWAYATASEQPHARHFHHDRRAMPTTGRQSPR